MSTHHVYAEPDPEAYHFNKAMTEDITADFKDSAFRAYVLEEFCLGKSFIRRSDINNVTSLNIPIARKLTSLAGIQHFSRLEHLKCSYHELKTLDLTRNPMLVTLNCESCELTELDLVANVCLESLNCNQNALVSLDLSGNRLLKNLECWGNGFNTLDISANTCLENLNCCNNPLLSLDLSQNSRLKNLECSITGLINLELACCPELRVLRCFHNRLKSLDLSACKKLVSLRCFRNELTELDISHNPCLVELFCSENQLRQLDTSRNPVLTTISYGNNLMFQDDYQIEGVGTFVYNNSRSVFSCESSIASPQLIIETEARNSQEMKNIEPLIIAVFKKWENIQARARRAIQKRDPDIQDMVFCTLEFPAEGGFRLGVDLGESPAGQHFVYAIFTNKLVMRRELIDEVY